MRLLRVEDGGEFSLVEFVGRNIPRYTVLSHTWGADDEEVSLKDLMEGTGKTKAGYRKIQFCGKHTANDNLQYFWVDTCCIDRSSSAELSEAINSMFRWYQGAAKCYVYLSDVSLGGSVQNDSSSQQTWEQAFRHSRWFTRGWTLQELIAPTFVDFFSAEGERLGDKTSLVQEINGITGVSVQALQGRSLADFSADERMLWAERRETKREEDAAYSLLGIFDIYMPLIYGEGRKRAFVRLQKEIKESLEDGPSTSPSALSSEERTRKHEPTSTAPFDRGSDFAELSNYEKHPSNNGRLQKGSMDAIPMWPGDIIRTGFSGVYLQQRDMMSNAAYYGRWDEVRELLEAARDAHGENWANVVRLKHPQVADKASFWTPLHQAAYLCAPINVVRYLIANGSLRTLRTRHSDAMFKHRDLTATEIARVMGHLHLTDILAPVIYHPVPHSTLARLQALFHEMIRADSREVSNLVLPELVTLTELRVPEMWFPLKHKTAQEHAIGYRYRLENRELVVAKLGIEKKSPSVYRISEGVVVSIQHPLISNE